MEKKRFQEGLAVRRDVLGPEYVDKAMNNVDEFNQEFQELVTEYCWGEVWTRQGLPRKMRSIINLAMLTALNRPQELEAHIKGALRNGVTKEEIKEVFLQCAIYCGIPAGVESFKIASKVFKSEGLQG